MREIRLSEELDCYNLRLFHPLLQYRSATYKYRLVVDGKRWEETAALKTGHEDRISAWMWAGAVRNVEDLSLAELSAHFSDLNLVLSGVRDSPFGWSFDSMELRCTKRE